jgi:hypothetical protein
MNVKNKLYLVSVNGLYPVGAWLLVKAVGREEAKEKVVRAYGTPVFDWLTNWDGDIDIGEVDFTDEGVAMISNGDY